MNKKAINLSIKAAYDAVVGIDPDKKKSGVAYLAVGSKQLELSTLSFVDTLDYLSFVKKKTDENKKNVVVVIEGGWLNHSVWHVLPNDTKAVAAKKGYAVGQNHQTGMFLQEFCERIGLRYKVVKPLRKCWSGPDHKITHNELVEFTGLLDRRTNQEERDAALLAWVEAGLPIRIRPKR